MSKPSVQVGDWVCVEWDDANSDSGWMTPEDAKEDELFGVETIGRVVYFSRARIVLAASRASRRRVELYSDRVAIPRPWVTKIHKLKKPKGVH